MRVYFITLFKITTIFTFVITLNAAVLEIDPTGNTCDSPTPCNGDGPTPDTGSDSNESGSNLNDNLIMWVSNFSTAATDTNINTYIDLCQSEFDTNCSDSNNCGSALWQLITDSEGRSNVKIDVWGSTLSSSPSIRFAEGSHPFSTIIATDGWNFKRADDVALVSNISGLSGATVLFPFNALENGVNACSWVSGTAPFCVPVWTGTANDGQAFSNEELGAVSGNVRHGDPMNPFLSSWTEVAQGLSSQTWRIYCLAGQIR